MSVLRVPRNPSGPHDSRRDTLERNRVSNYETITRLERVRQAFADLGPVVYFVRTKTDLIKIGWTGNLRERRRSLRVDYFDILAVIPGDRALERAMHRRFAASRERGELFRPTLPLVAFINDLRQRMNVPPIEVAAA